jgi:hypothetical protein
MKYNKMSFQVQDIWDGKDKIGAEIFVFVTMFKLALCPFFKKEVAGS